MSNEIESAVELVVRERPALAIIRSNTEAQTIGAYLVKVKEIRKRIAEFFDENIDKANKLHKGLVAQKKAVEAKPVQVEMECKRLLTDWQVAEQERIRKAQEEADRKAQEEANRLAKEEALRKAKEEGDKKQVEAIKKGKIEVVAAPVASVAVEEAPKIEGASLREYYAAEVTSLQELCKAVATGKCPPEYVTANMVVLNQVARATKGQIQVPGVKMVKRAGTVSRT